MKWQTQINSYQRYKMSSILHTFTDKITTITGIKDIFEAIADCFPTINKNIYCVCLQIDPKSFELKPVRDIDHVLIKNIQDSLDHGICGQIREPHKVVFLTEQEKYAMKEDSNLMLVPLFSKDMMQGIIVVAFPKGMYEILEGMKKDLDVLTKLGSTHFDTLRTLAIERESNREHSAMESRLNDIVQNVVHGLIALDTNNHICIFNKNAEIIFNVSSQSVLGKSYRDAFPKKLVRALDILIESTLIEGSILDYEIDVEIAPSVSIPVGISTSILRDRQGFHQGIILVSRDMSLTKEVNRLKDLDKMKSEFVSTVSHELKNPIAIIKSSVETLLAARRLGRALDAKFEADSLESINDEINRLSQLINDLLNLARMESGKVEVRKESTNIERLLAVTVHMFKIHEETHPVNLDCTNVNKSILIDPDKIKQVLINYIGNAVKYSPNGSPIDVKAWIEDNELKITVADHGIGIPEDKVATVFDKFTRISTEETASIGGTGLGLSICQKIIDLHRGKVWCKSKYKEGSTFGFSIPISAYSEMQAEKENEG